MSWPLAALADIAPAKPIKLNGYTPSDRIWQVTLDQIESNTGLLLEKSIKPLSEAGSSTHAFDDRHVLYSKLRPYLNKVLLPDETGLGTTELVPMLPASGRLDRVYLAHYLKSKTFVNWISSQTAGAKMPRVSMNTFWEHQIPLPPLPEQKRIAAILDKADSLRRKNQQAIQLADQFLRAVFLDMFGDPVANPKDWDKRQLEDICLQVIDCPHSTPKWSSAGVIGLRTSNLTKGGWNWDDKRFVSEGTYKERTKRAELKVNDIILSREGTVGVAALVPPNLRMCMGQRLVQLRVNTDILSAEYMLFLLLYELEPERLSKVMTGSTSKHLNVKDLRKLSVAIPPIEIQLTFAKIFTKIKISETHNSLGESYAQVLFDSLSQKAFAGKL